MKNTVLVIIGLLITIVFTGCFSPSNDEIASVVKKSMQETLDTSPEFKEYGLNVENLETVKQSDGKYNGVASVLYDGDIYKVPVTIVVDGEDFMWQTEPTAFMFIAKKEIEKMTQELSNPDAMEGIDFFKMFAFDKGVRANCNSWDTGMGSKIDWKHAGVLETPNERYPNLRKGEVKLMNNGEITHGALGRNSMIDGSWLIKAHGARCGILAIALESKGGGRFPYIDIDRKYVTDTIQCEGASVMSYVQLDEITLPNKKPFWLMTNHSQGASGGGEEWYVMYYDKPKYKCNDGMMEIIKR